jgi:dolichyl-phosphate-mannose-protein mannosyltransferase
VTQRLDRNVAGLTLLALLTRCWMLFSPRAVVWDEVHYERFAGAYLTGRYYVDVHPPFAKMLIAWCGALFGVSPATFAGLQPAVAARILPAVAGALVIPVVYLILRELGAGPRSALFGAALLRCSPSSC